MLGAVTIAWRILIGFVLPDNPVVARFLAPEERVPAVERMRPGQTGIENPKFKVKQMREALLDVKTWAFVLIAFFVQLNNGAVSVFG